MNKFFVHPANKTIWNYDELLQFLIQNQGQKIIIEINEGPCCKTIGLYNLLEKFNYNDVIIQTTNLIEQHNKFTIKTVAPFRFLTLDKETDYSKFHTWDQTHIFGCFYNRPLWYRLGLASVLQHDYADQSVINVRCNPHDFDNRLLFEVQQLFENHPQSHLKFATVSNAWPRQLETNDTYGFCTTNEHTDQLAYFYPGFLIDIVAETWAHGNCFFPTEKTIRPMLLKKPFIVFGGQDYLEYLRQMGFRTFGDFWDETYDGYEGADRYIRILELIDRLAEKSIDELEIMYWDMQYTLDHNYDLLVRQQFSKKIQRLE